jgi:hypothetical protein
VNLLQNIFNYYDHLEQDWETFYEVVEIMTLQLAVFTENFFKPEHH